MWLTNLKILGVVLATVGAYTLIANAIPQVESDVPEELDLSGEVTTAQLVAAGRDLFEGAGGCTSCHGLGTRAPNLRTDHEGEGAIGRRCGARVEGMDCKAYLHQSLVAPGDYVVDGFQPIMPDASRTLSEQQIWALVAYLQDQGGEVTVTSEDFATGPLEPGGAETEAGPGVDPGISNPVAILDEYGCFTCHRLGERGTEVGPPFTDVGARRDAAYIRRSILDPRADASEGYEDFATVMPTNFGERMTAAQMETVVEFLAEQTGSGRPSGGGDE